MSTLKTARRRGFGAAILAASLAAAAAFVPAAQAATVTVNPTEPGTPPVVRDASLNISLDQGARTYFRTNGTGTTAQKTYNPQSATILITANVIPALAQNLVCRGDNPAVGGKNDSPRDTVTVTGPGGVTAPVAVPVSLAREFSLTSGNSTPKHRPLSPQPVPGNTNYHGDVTVVANDNTYHGHQTTVDLTGKPAGIYTVSVSSTNMVKTGASGACIVGTPKVTDLKQFDPGAVTTTTTFEYRPWQHQFNDVFGKGRVTVNVTPKEFKFVVDGNASAIYPGSDKSQTFYALPSADSFALPSDPAVCASDPSTCIPSAAVKCEPDTSSCTPRLMILNSPVKAPDSNGIVGVFDFDTKAFIALSKVDGTSRTLMSLGTDNDSIYHDVLNNLSTYAAENGTDLASILATKIRLRSGDTETSLSLLNGLQVDPTTGHDGIQIVSDGTVQAGIILNIYAELGGTCTAQTGDSDESTSAPDRFVRSGANGYTVTKSDLLPEVPRVGPLGALVGGPLYHIVGKFGTGALVNTTGAIIGADTAADEPNGYPVWINPFLSGSRLATVKTMDFLGTATWSASESSTAIGCLSVNFMLGAGVAVLNNPLSVGLGTIFDPLATPSPAAQQLTDAVNDAVDQVVGTVTSDPTVDSLLTQVTALLPLS